MRVVVLMDNPLIPTGYASTCRLTAQELSKRGHEVYCMAFNGGGDLDSVRDWYGVKIVPNYALARDKNAIYGDLQTILKVEEDVRPDAYFFHNDAYRYSYLKDAPEGILNKSVFWLPFEGSHPDVAGLDLFNRVAATRFVTRHALEIHEKHLKGKDVGYVPHAIDLSAMGPAADKRAAKRRHVNPRFGRDVSGHFVVTRVDRHQPRKYWDRTLRAFARFAEGKDDVVMLCKCNPRDITMHDAKTGKGVDLEKLADELGVRDKVAFDDFFFHAPQLAESLLQPADVFLTTTSGEGFGLGCVESMACGVPVLYPDTPVLPEVVGDAGLRFRIEERAWYAPMNVWHNLSHVADAAARLQEAYDDWKAGGEKLRAMGERGMELARTRYSPKDVYDQWDELLRDVATRGETVTLVTLLYTLSPEQVTGEDGVERLRETIEKHVKHPYEWIIVDNGSPEREVTRQWIKGAAANNRRIRPLLLDWNRGFAGGNNAAIAMARGKHVILVNPDSEALDPGKLGLPADFVAMMARKAESDPEIGVVGMELKRRDDIVRGLEFPYFGCALITRRCLDACRMGEGKWLDDAFFPSYYEDAAFCLRAQGKGFKLVQENVPFWHKSGGTNRHAIEGGKDGPHVQRLMDALDEAERHWPGVTDFEGKRRALRADGMQGVIQANIDQLRARYGDEARSRIKIVIESHVGAGVGFSEITEGLAPELHRLGFDVYINDWSNGANLGIVKDPLVGELVEKYRRANEEDRLDGAIHVVIWLMETFLNCPGEYKVGVSFCESTKVRESYLQACNQMDRILTFSNFCKQVQVNSGYRPPIHVLPPGVKKSFLEPYERPRRDKFTFLAVGVAQERKDTRQLVRAFAEAFPKGAKRPPECEPGFPLTCDQVELVLKSNNFGDLEWVHREGFSDRANIRTIFTGWYKGAERKDFTEEEMIELYHSADCLVHLSHGEGIGLPICFPGDALVLTGNGPVRISDLRVNDLVLTHKGRERRIKNTMGRLFDGKLTEIIGYLNNEVLACTPDHPILVARKVHKNSNDPKHRGLLPTWVAARDIKKGDLLIVPRSRQANPTATIDLANYLPGKEFDEDKLWSKYSNRQDNGITASKLAEASGVSQRQVYRVMQGLCRRPKTKDYVSGETSHKVRMAMAALNYESNHKVTCPRWLKMDYDTGLLLGYYAAEGSIQKHNVSFSFHEDETDYHGDVRRLMSKKLGVDSDYVHRSKNYLSQDGRLSKGYEMIFSSICAAEVFKKLCGTGAKDKTLGTDLTKASAECQLGFLRGAWRGDGSIHLGATSASVSFSTSSPNMAYQIWAMLLNMGKQAGIRRHFRKKSNEFNITYTYCGYDDITKINHEPTGRRRSFYRKTILADDYVLVPVRSVRQRAFRGKVHNIEVEEDNSYCVNGYAVHNCEAAATSMPVIFTNWSSPAEYFDESNSYPCSLSPYPGTTFTKAYPGAPGDNGEWANSHYGHAKHLMYHVIRNQGEAREKGRRAREHMAKNFTWEETARRMMPLVFEWEAERTRKAKKNDFDPRTFAKPKIEPVRKGDRLMIDVVSRDRHDYLSCLLVSLMNQTFKDWDIIVQCDDADESMPQNHLILSLMARLHHEGHGWRIIRSHRQGPHVAHDRTLQMTRDNPGYKYKLICRIDDDIIVEPDYLQKLFDAFAADEKCEIAAVGGTYLDPKRSEKEQTPPKGWESSPDYAGKIDHNVPWPYVCRYPDGTPLREVEHIYSSFMFRVEVADAIGGYCTRYSQVGHREESDFSYRFFLAGYRQLVHPEARGWHFTAPRGGIRSSGINDGRSLAEGDHKIYESRLRKWKKQLAEKQAADKQQRDAAQAKRKPEVPAIATELRQDDGGKPYRPGKVAAIVNGRGAEAAIEGLKRFGGMADELYLVLPDDEAKKAIAPSCGKTFGAKGRLAMVVSGAEESAAMLRAIMAEGDHEFVLTVADNMSFLGDPLALLDDRHDNYVFEVYSTYRNVRPVGPGGVEEAGTGPVVGPEARNECLLHRRGTRNADASRTLYADVVVVQDDKLDPRNGKSSMGHELLPLADFHRRAWTKVCVYQWPEGRLSPPRQIKVPRGPMVSILIPTPGRRALLKKCLDSIYSHTTTPFEVVVVDNASSDGTAEMLAREAERRPEIRVIRADSNVGYQKAMNMAVAKSRGEYLMLFNDDAWVNGPEPDGRDWLRTYVDELEANPGLGIIGPHGGESPALGGRILYFWCVLMRRSTWDDVGPLDDATFLNYGGDDDYCERLRAKGYGIGEKVTNLRHLMTCVPEHVKKPELLASREKLRAKYGKAATPGRERAKA